MKTKYAFLLFATTFLLNLKSQVNLVPNASFETTLSCPASAGYWSSCANWNNVNMNLGPGMWGTPDYFHPCGSGNTAPPITFAGTCTPHTGNSMMALVLYNVPYPDYREYLSTQLTCSMIPGVTYTVSFWVTNGSGPISPWIIRNIGIHFSTATLTQSGWSLINVTPQCEVTTTIASTSWVQYNFTVNPTANWKYLTLGSFRNDVNNSPISHFPNYGGTPSVYANYFFDDITVMAPSTNSTISVTSNNGNFTVCAGKQLTLTANGASSYTWNTNAVSPTLVVSPAVTSNYTVSAILSSGCSNTLVNSVSTVSVLPLPSVNITGNNLVCHGQSASLTASGALNYNWSNGATGAGIVVSPASTTAYTVTGTSAAGCTINAIATVSVTECNDISEKTLSTFDYNLYPNPVKQDVNLSFTTAENLPDAVEIFNAIGELVYVYSFNPNNKQSNTTQIILNLHTLSQGIYSLKIKKDDRFVTLKLVKD